MEYEIELKLLISEDAGEVIERELLPRLDAKVSRSTQSLINHYFDTSEGILRQHDIGLRIRGNGNFFEQTLKTAGKSIGGLHQRPEYNVQLNEEKGHSLILPTLSLFPAVAWPKHIDISTLQTEITTLFSTNFERNLFLIEQGEQVIELVLDKGYIKSGDKQVPICELELELKKGDINALFSLAKQLVVLIPTTIGLDSKAARGYQLITSPSPEDGLDEVLEKLALDKLLDTESVQHDKEVDIALAVGKKLSLFQNLSAAIRKQYHPLLAEKMQQVLHSLNNDIQLLYKQNTPVMPFSVVSALQILVNEWDTILEQNNQHQYAALLTQAQTTQWQLDLTQFLIQQLNS